MYQIEKAAVTTKIGIKHFDSEMREAGLKLTKENRIRYKIEQTKWLRGLIIDFVKVIYIRRCIVGVSRYFSLKVEAVYNNRIYTMHIPMMQGNDCDEVLIRKAGIVPIGLLACDWLEYKGVEVIDEGYFNKKDMYKSAI